jgi:hypothetical protein
VYVFYNRRNKLKQLAFVTLLATALILSGALTSVAAPNIYGENGLMEVPNDQTYPVGTITPAYHGVYSVDVGGTNETVNFYTVGVGILPNLSVSGGFKTNGNTDAIINGKYRVTAETKDRPSITVGVIDAASKLSISDDPSLYVLLGKNLTATAEKVAGDSKPLRGYVGLGTGVLKGFFTGLDWRLTSKFSAMLEFVGSDEGVSNDSHLNGGIRYSVTKDLKVDVGLYNMKDLSAGVSYSPLKF